MTTLVEGQFLGKMMKPQPWVQIATVEASALIPQMLVWDYSEVDGRFSVFHDDNFSRQNLSYIEPSLTLWTFSSRPRLLIERQRQDSTRCNGSTNPKYGDLIISGISWMPLICLVMEADESEGYRREGTLKARFTTFQIMDTDSGHGVGI